MSDLTRASATLDRAAVVFAEWLDWPDQSDQPGTITHAMRSRVVGNGLRELDRFLSILIDALCVVHDFPSSPRQRNTANKLRALQTLLGSSRDDHARMIALGRSRACLFHCAGVITRGDQEGSLHMTLGWPGGLLKDGKLLSATVGAAIVMTRSDFREVADFYQRLATDLAQLSNSTL